ncbi:hypothetical protein [Agromyces aureus]|uniref:Uncharacterized protein n=1 Tax=Agromyces aureus TaxID=453304 RepID=A0A191WC71_9MICO|nr:hypothetical protein [Agromyces aureus]ANJ25779.1 hypothetical protein ATC03_02395 [Agromyces aureus]
MDIDWQQLIWDARWTALELLWNAFVLNVAAHWWFGPLVVVLLILAGWKKLARVGVYIARAFGHTHAG